MLMPGQGCIPSHACKLGAMQPLCTNKASKLENAHHAHSTTKTPEMELFMAFQLLTSWDGKKEKTHQKASSSFCQQMAIVLRLFTSIPFLEKDTSMPSREHSGEANSF